MKNRRMPRSLFVCVAYLLVMAHALLHSVSAQAQLPIVTGSLQIKRSAAEAGIPTLADGQFCYAKDTGRLFIGTNGLGNKLVAVPLRVQVAGVLQPLRNTLNFTGSGVSVSDDAANGRTNVTIAGGGGGGGTVTSVGASGGSTGLTFGGSPITTSGTFTLGGILSLGSGGTGATSASSALANLGGTPLTRSLTAGAGLTGGGDLTANRTFSLASTSVTAGSYTNANITVDAQGRLTAAANGSAGSGGSGSGSGNQLYVTGTPDSSLPSTPVDVLHFNEDDFTLTDEGNSGTIANQNAWKIAAKNKRAWFGYVNVSARLQQDAFLSGISPSLAPGLAVGDYLIICSDYTGNSSYEPYTAPGSSPVPVAGNMAMAPLFFQIYAGLWSGNGAEVVTATVGTTGVPRTGAIVKLHKPEGLSGAVGGRALVEVSPATTASYGTYIYRLIRITNVPSNAEVAYSGDIYELGFTLNDAQTLAWGGNPPKITTVNGQFNNGTYVGPPGGITSFIAQTFRQERRAKLTSTQTIAAPASANVEEVYIPLDCSGGNRTFTINVGDFYSIAGNAPQRSCKIVFQRVDATANTCTIQSTSGQYINGGSNATYQIAGQFKTVIFFPYSTNVWWVISG